MDHQLIKYRIRSCIWLLLVFGFVASMPLTAFALEQMSDVQLENIYAQNAADAQIAAGPIGETLFHYDNAINPISQAVGDLQTSLGGASDLGQFAGPPAAVQNAVSDAQTVASGTTVGLGGI